MDESRAYPEPIQPDFREPEERAGQDEDFHRDKASEDDDGQAPQPVNEASR